jgi:hypothetical protein
MSCYDLSDLLGGEGGGRWSERDSGVGEDCFNAWTGDITKNFVKYKSYKLGVSVGSLTNVGGAVLRGSMCRLCKVSLGNSFYAHCKSSVARQF